MLGDSREVPSFVETVQGKGYRFVSNVDVVPRSTAQTSAASQLPRDVVPEVRRHNLPAQMTSFVGRQHELVELSRLLSTSRLLSLAGPGGVGKTRLALQLASDLASRFPDGVWLIELGPLGVPELVAQAIATALGIRESPQRSVREALLDNLCHRELLLVLDTCEHLVDACAELCEALLRVAPTLRIVATSREALGIPGGTVTGCRRCRCRWRSVRYPFTSSPSARRRSSSSLARRPSIPRSGPAPPTPRQSRDLPASRRDSTGHRAGGSPCSGAPPEQIEMRLDDRFRLLTGGARTAVARQRTLEATVDWSYQLLSDAERLLLCRLSIFPASWALEAAEDIGSDDAIAADDVLDLLSRLIDKSLVSIENDGRGRRRYRLLETVRQYARERLLRSGEVDRLRERHFEFYFNAFRGALVILRGPGQLTAREIANRTGERTGGARMGALVADAFRERRGTGRRAVLVLDQGRSIRGRQALARMGPEGGRPTAAEGAGADRPGAHALLPGAPSEAGACVGEALSLGRQDDDAWRQVLRVVSAGPRCLRVRRPRRGDRPRRGGPGRGRCQW